MSPANLSTEGICSCEGVSGSESHQFLHTQNPCRSAIALKIPRYVGSQKLYMNACPLQIFPQKGSAFVKESLAVKATSFYAHVIRPDLPLH